MNAIKPAKPVRKIGITNRSVSGIVPGTGRYESSLERDLMELLRFDYSVESTVPQPVTVPYVTRNGGAGEYTPDGLIYFEPELALPPVLYEVKYRRDFRDSWKELLPKFRAAKEFALNQGWQFEVYTEKEIRTPYLQNAKFLLRYKNQAISKENASHILTYLEDLKTTDPQVLLHAMCYDKDNQALFIPVLWHLIANGYVGCDLDSPLTMTSKIWTLGVPYEAD